MQPTAVFVPLAQLLSPEHFPVATTELFGPFQVGLREGILTGLAQHAEHLVGRDPHVSHWATHVTGTQWLVVT